MSERNRLTLGFAIAGFLVLLFVYGIMSARQPYCGTDEYMEQNGVASCQ